MLARISSHCKIMVFSDFELGNIIINHPKVTNKVALSNIEMPLKCTVKIGITPQNMPQTYNSLLSPTKSMVARGNQW